MHNRMSEAPCYLDREADLGAEIRELANRGAASYIHSGRTLLDHLYGVSQVLASWQCEVFIVRAGLFHSVYNRDHPLFERHERFTVVAPLIGFRAERLAFHYSSGQVRDAAIPDLFVIRAANLLEQCQFVDLEDVGATAEWKYVHSRRHMLPDAARDLIDSVARR
jgi:hypothetical protein